MVENTRLKDLTTEIKRIFNALDHKDQHELLLSNHLKHLESSLDTNTRALDCLNCSVNKLSESSSIGASNSGSGVAQPIPTSASTFQPFQMRPVKLDFPKFDGTNPLNWLFCAEQFFSYYDTPDLL